ncbi:MAG: PAS domain S-box protein [Nostocales cyanobacterium]|nr:MAG: PAS domain S-box protein [Nostocales cyanobacterium]TAF16241.1 MAG: PAS domain S-box protein [Nostocales cyanobacterium]
MQLKDQLITPLNLYKLVNHHPLMVKPDSLVIEAIVLMDQQQNHHLETQTNSKSSITINNQQNTADCVLVVDQKKVLGVFTTKNLIRLIASGRDLSQTKMIEVMVHQSITIKESDLDHLCKISSVFQHYEIDYLPIVDDQEDIVGIVAKSALSQKLDDFESIEHQLFWQSQDSHLHNQEICFQENPIVTKLLKKQFQEDIKITEKLQQTIEKLQAIGEGIHQYNQQLLLAYQTAELKIQRYYSLFTSTPYGYVITNKCGIIEEANQAAKKLLSVDQKYILGEIITDFIAQSQRQSIIYQLTKNEIISKIEVNLQPKTGNQFPASLRIAPIYNTQNQHSGWSWFISDLSERKQIERELLKVTEELEQRVKDRTAELLLTNQILQREIKEHQETEVQLRESEARLNLALETANMGIWEKKVEDRTTCIWSDTIGQLYGLEKGSLCPPSKEFFQLIYPEDQHIIVEAITDSIEKGEEFTIVYRVVWPDGSIHWLRSTGKLFYDSDGEPVNILGTTTDISDRKHKEQTLSEQAALLDIATDAIFVRDFHTEILFWNQGAEKIYGWSKDEAIGSNLQNLFYSKISPKQEAIALKNIVKSGKWNGELRKQTKRGKEIIVESRWSLMLDNDGNPKSILIVDTDITKKKQLEDQFYRTQRLQSIGTLAGGIAHDLNNILSPILTSAQLIKGKFAQDPERHLQMLNIIENNARRGSALVKQVLSFAKGIKGERTTVQVKHLITEILNFAKKTFPKSITFSSQIPEHLATVFGDSTQLYQVLMNLVVNARDAMPDGGNLTIVAENMFIDEVYSQMHIEAKTGHYIVISVSDTGVGIPPEILEQIFERFFTTKEIDSGSGFGLSTVEEIVTNHNGFLTVDSEVGKGSIFKVFLPAVQSPELPTLEEFDITPSNGELILIVDDEPEIVDVTKIILENNNYRILTASNGIEAIAIYQQYQQKISVVLMDMMMPDMDGVTAISSLQKMNPNVQVIICSGLGTIDSLPKSAETKVQGVLFKPYTANELLINLNQVIGNR